MLHNFILKVQLVFTPSYILFGGGRIKFLGLYLRSDHHSKNIKLKQIENVRNYFFYQREII